MVLRDFHHSPADGSQALSTPADSVPVRIVSTGNGADTQVLVGGVPVSGCVAATWRVTGGGVARALIEVDCVALTHEPNTADEATEKEVM
jgi:hypothetical protein